MLYSDDDGEDLDLVCIVMKIQIICVCMMYVVRKLP